MADTKADARDVSWRRLVPWTEIFNGFKLTLDPNKLFLAALGILFMALAWWVLAVIFGATYEKRPDSFKGGNQDWNVFVQRRESWNLMHEAAGIGGSAAKYLPQDLATSPSELEKLDKTSAPKEEESVDPIKLKAELLAAGVDPVRAEGLANVLYHPKPGGRMTTWPWFESRGPNPYLLVTGQTGKPWETGHFWEWFAFEQAPVLVEPLVKLLRPVVYLLHPRADFVMRIYCFLVLLSTLIIWSIFGGAIARITVMYQTRKEQIDAFEALRFSRRRWLSYIGAPLFPLGITLVCLVFGMVLGLLYLIPWVGDIFVAGLGWFLFVALGAAMAVLLIGLISWPLMPATISTEGRDAWEAFSRSYAYLFSKPWQYIWYALVAIAYGAVLIFFVNFLGSFSLYMSKWTITHTPGISAAGREPNFLFIYAPTTFGYRDLLLDGAVVDGQPVVRDGKIDPRVYKEYVSGEKSPLGFNNKAGAALVAFWLSVILLVIVGFGYAYFWTASTLIYLLLRRQIDTAEVDEVYLDDEDSYRPAATTGPVTPRPVTATTPTSPQPQMVESPTLRPTPPPGVVPMTPPTSAPAPTPAPTPTPTPTPAPAPTPAPTPASTPTPSSRPETTEKTAPAREEEVDEETDEPDETDRKA